MVDEVHYSSDNDYWETPQKFYDELNEEFQFEWDVCATYMSAKCADFYSQEDDALSKDWSEDFKIGWMNPPYSKGLQKKFLAKAAEQQEKGVTTVALVPSRTDTIAWHSFVWDKETHKPRENVEVRLIKGRLKFEIDGLPVLGKNGKPQTAPFPSAIIIFKGKVNE